MARRPDPYAITAAAASQAACNVGPSAWLCREDLKAEYLAGPSPGIVDPSSPFRGVSEDEVGVVPGRYRRPIAQLVGGIPGNTVHDLMQMAEIDDGYASHPRIAYIASVLVVVGFADGEGEAAVTSQPPSDIAFIDYSDWSRLQVPSWAWGMVASIRPFLHLRENVLMALEQIVGKDSDRVHSMALFGEIRPYLLGLPEAVRPLQEGEETLDGVPAFLELIRDRERWSVDFSKRIAEARRAFP